MPVILESDAWPGWLGEEDAAPAELMKPAAEGRAAPLGRQPRRQHVRNNGAALLDRVDDPHAPPPSDSPPGQNPA